MSFLNYIRESFSRVLVEDSEFVFDTTKTTRKRVVCFVYIDVFTGEKFRYWENKLGSSPRHFDYDEVLLINYNATAEVGSHLKQLHGKPRNVWDALIENYRLYKNVRYGKGANTLLATAEFYGIEDRISEKEKDDNVKLIVENETYTLEQQKQILDYCESDTELLRKIFIKQVEDIQDKNKLKTESDFKKELWQILNRGTALSCVSQVERNGIPIDNPLLNKFRTYWPHVKNKLIRRYNKDLGVFTDDLVFNHAKFNELIIKNGLADRWIRMKNGNFTTNKNYLRKFLRIPFIKKLMEIRTFQNMTKLVNYKIGDDGRARTSLNFFNAITGRATPSSSYYPFGGPKWVRNFIKPSWGNYLVYIDYVSQEPAIMGYLSGDQELIKVYQSGEDIYIAMAKQFQMVPELATKSSHKSERKVFKTLYLAGSYGAGPGYVSDEIKCSVSRAKELLIKFKRKYKTYFRWIDGILEGALDRGKIETIFGWQRYITDLYQYKNGKRVDVRRSLLNWPIQSHGAEILRRALIDLCDEHFEVCATVHDAVLIQIPTCDLKSRLEEAKQIMVNASRFVVGGPIRVDHEIIKGNFEQEPEDQIIFNEIMKEIDIYKGTPELGLEVPPNRAYLSV